MTTFVGTQKDFSKALQELVELEYETIEVYEAAINRVENENYRQGLSNAKSDHKEHIKQLTEILTDKNIEVPQGPSGMQLIAIGKVAIANLLGDQAILRAMIQLENDTQTAYKRMNDHQKKFPETETFLMNSLADENRNITWLKTVTE